MNRYDKTINDLAGRDELAFEDRLRLAGARFAVSQLAARAVEKQPRKTEATSDEKVRNVGTEVSMLRR